MRGIRILFSSVLVAAIAYFRLRRIPARMPDHLIGIWGGPHAGVDFQGGLADVQFDCASGTIDDPSIRRADGSFSVKGTYRTGPPGPVKVGQFFKSQDAIYSGQVTKERREERAAPDDAECALEDGTSLGPFTLTEGMPPQLTHCA